MAHVGESLDPETTYRRQGAFESTAIYVGSEMRSTAMEICRENKRELASHPDEAGGSASTLNLSATDSPRCVNQPILQAWAVLSHGIRLGQELERGPQVNFPATTGFKEKIPLKKPVNSI